MSTGAWPRWIRFVPAVGLVVLLVRRRRGPRNTGPGDPHFEEQWELTDAWIVTLGALLGLIIVLVLAKVLPLGLTAMPLERRLTDPRVVVSGIEGRDTLL